jgi:excinuclease ABC subunit C
MAERRRRRRPEAPALRPTHAKVAHADATVSSAGGARGVPEEVLATLPTDPGVYVFKDAAGKVIYVGKAKNLRARVRQYFRPGADPRFFVAAGFLGRSLADLETIVVSSEKEALLLENHLIKQHQPRFNVNLRDDKQYLVLRLRAPAAAAAARRDLFPRVEVVRNIHDDGARYFGPYHSATSARETLRVLNRHFQLRTCTDHVLETRGRPCLQYQIKRCPAPCAFPVDPAAYREQVEDAFMFLVGRDQELVARLRGRMTARAEHEDYEAAARLRDSVAAVERTIARQNVVQEEPVDQDVFGLWREADVVEVVVLFVRGGKLVGRRAFHQRDIELPDGEVIAQHVQQYYATGTLIPDEVVVGVELPDADLLADWLGAARGTRVRLVQPQRGVRARLVDLADRNAAVSAMQRKGRDDDALAALAKLQARLGLRRLPRRIECYDIAHLQGSETVASMVTFLDGKPARALYRTFKIRSADNDDFAAMYEVLSRRLRRVASGAAGDPGWAPPDLLVVDGGKGQLGSATAALTDLGLPLAGEQAIDVIALAKERDLAGAPAPAAPAARHPDRVFLRNVKDPVQLRPHSAELYVLARIRDEAHRVANTFHQRRRGKASLRSALDAVPGIGAVRRKALLRHFGSVKAIRAASVDELAAAPGMNRRAAQAVHDHLAEARR